MNAGDHNAELPLDSDSDYSAPGPATGSAAAPARALHLRLGFLALVAAGGVVGTAARIGVTLLVDQSVDATGGSFPIAIFAINIVGAFVLGMLLQALTARGPDTGRRRTLRLLLGTGVLGGFTTYSALSSDSAVLLTSGGVALALGYGLATVVLGALASWAGIALGAALGSPEGRDRMPVDSDASGDPR